MAFDPKQCEVLWDALSMSVHNLVECIEAPRGSVQLLGFADLHLFVAGLPCLVLPRTALKLIRGRVHFDPQTINGNGEKKTVLFPTWRPSTAESREVLSVLLSEVEEVQALVARAQKSGVHHV